MDESKNNLIDNESKFIEFSGLNRELYITLLRNRSAKCKLIEYTQRGAPLYRARSLGAAHVHHVVPRRRAAGGRLPAPPHATGSQPAGGLRRRTEHGKCTVDTYLLFTYVDHNIFEFLINSIKLN